MRICSILALSIALLVNSACDAPANDQKRTSNPTPGLEQSGSVSSSEQPQSDVPPPSREKFTNSACDYEEWIGKPLDEEAVKATGKTYRILTPDSTMTMDFSAERLNVVHDKGKVVRVWCG